MKLQPLETAPKDGSEILVKISEQGKDRFEICHWRVNSVAGIITSTVWEYEERDGSLWCCPDEKFAGWMPIPDDPS